MKKLRIFGLFRQLLRPLLTALALGVMTGNVFGYCWPVDDAAFYPTNASNANLDGCMYITLSGTPALYTAYTSIKNSQSPLEITFGATAAPGPSLVLSAQGVFFVDWGNGSVLRINKTNTSPRLYYFGSASNATTVKIYSNTSTISAYSDYCPAITVNPEHSENRKGQKCGGAINSTVASKITSIGGCLGCVFPTLSSGAQPLFISSFANLPGLANIPDGQFFYKGSTGITGEAADYQFAFMFHNDTGLSNNITLPANYFNGLTKAGESTFYGMFSTSGVADISWDGTIYCAEAK